MTRKPPLTKIEPVIDEAAAARFREQVAEHFGPGWQHKVIILPPGHMRVTRMNVWQRLRWRVAKWIMP